MKIIKAGVVPVPVCTVYAGTCRHCGCEFEAEEDDLKQRKVDVEYVNCPTCHRPVNRYEMVAGVREVKGKDK